MSCDQRCVSACAFLLGCFFLRTAPPAWFVRVRCSHGPIQNPQAHPHGVIFFAGSFAVDPGKGEHVSYKINHSATRPNLRATTAKASDDSDMVVLRASRVRV